MNEIEPHEPHEEVVDGEIVQSSSEKVELPKEGKVDNIKRLVKGAVGQIPIAGSFAAEFVDVAWKTQYQKNMDNFLLDYATRVLNLEVRVDNLEARLQSPLIVGLSIEAARAAATAASDEKRVYLANALLNVVEDPSWDGNSDYAEILLRLVRELTPLHILLLDLLTDPEAWSQSRQINLRSQLDATPDGRWLISDLHSAAFPGLNPDAVGAALRDLESRNLLGVTGAFEDGASMPSADDLMSGFSTNLGRDLLRFVTRD